MPTPRTSQFTTINTSAATELTLPPNYSIGGGLGLIRLYNDSDVDMDYILVVDGTTPTATQVRSGGSTLLKQKSRMVQFNSQTKIFAVADSGSAKKIDIDWFGFTS
jgi:hypothetical protein